MNVRQFYISLLLASTMNMWAEQRELFINYYKENKLEQKAVFPFANGNVKDTREKEWSIKIDSTLIDGANGTVEYKVKLRLEKGMAPQVAVGVNFGFDDWSADNFVFIPSIVYNGNRFDIKQMNYPPYWYEKAEWKVDMPTTTPSVPTLEKYKDYGKIELTTGNAATPLMAFHSPKNDKVWMVQTKQGNSWGNYGLFVEENKDKGKAVFRIMSPAVRENRATGSGFVNSGDRGCDLKSGDEIEITFRTYKWDNASLQDMYSHFYDVRKDMNPIEKDYAVLPYSEVYKIMNSLFQKDRWNEAINMYSLTKPGTNSGWNQIWQLGWVGGGQVTYPFLLNGDNQAIERSIENLDVVFSKTQAPSGFYYAYGNGVEFASFGYSQPLKNNETLVRSQGDFLYMSLRQIGRIRDIKRDIPEHWINGIRKQADAFVRLWNKYGQVGQFVDVTTGDICIGGSTSGGIVPGGLALASEMLHNKEYLMVAEKLAEKYYNDFVLKGYTTGGPGEILSSPDSESAFGLFESYITLYEVTKNRKWLTFAKDLLPICASWVVSYDFEFPEQSDMNKINAHSNGSVWASIANKHSAPAICTWSGESLLKYYRYTDDQRAVDLLNDIAHGVPQYICAPGHKIGNMELGGACERVNLSDWEGKDAVGGNIFASCSWVETAVLLTVTQLPSIYVRKDKGQVEVFDHVILKSKKKEGNHLVLELQNPTEYDAELKIYVDDSVPLKNSIFDINDFQKVKKVVVKAKTEIEVKV